MPKIREYTCACGERFEHMYMTLTEVAVCPKCQRVPEESDEMLGGQPFSTIIPMYKGSKKMKAGHQHTHADRPAERGSVSIPANKGKF